MATEISQINLGFAEFVGQLLDETFEAIVSAQSLQSDRHRELEGALELPEDAFKARYLGADEQALVGDELAAVVDRRKIELRDALRGLQSARIVVDSGEIRARLELSSVSSAAAHAEPLPAEPKPRTPATPPKPGAFMPGVRVVERDGVRLLEIPDGDRTTLVIDRAALAARAAATPRLTQVRMIASPARPTSAQQSLSEVVIRFKAV